VSSLRDLIQRKADRFEPPPNGRERLTVRAKHRHRNRRAVAVAAAVVIAAAGTGGALSLLSRHLSQPARLAASPATSQPAASATPPASTAPMTLPGTVALAAFDEASQTNAIYLVTGSDAPVEIPGTTREGEAGLAWSPDGSHLLVTKGVSEGRGELLILDIKTGHSTILTTFGGPPMDPSWSTTGGEVAFTTGSGDVYVIQSDGSGLRQISSSGDLCADMPSALAPEGNTVAFSRGCDAGGQPGIYVADVHGGQPTLVLPLTAGPGALSWSPDGTKIAFSGQGPEGPGVYTVNADGTGLQQVTQEPDGAPIWSSDGSVIAFIRRNEQIWTVPAAGGTAILATDLAGFKLSSWAWFSAS
jgi:TolB protein